MELFQIHMKMLAKPRQLNAFHTFYVFFMWISRGSKMFLRDHILFGLYDNVFFHKDQEH